MLSWFCHFDKQTEKTNSTVSSIRLKQDGSSSCKNIHSKMNKNWAKFEQKLRKIWEETEKWLRNNWGKTGKKLTKTEKKLRKNWEKTEKNEQKLT